MNCLAVNFRGYKRVALPTAGRMVRTMAKGNRDGHLLLLAGSGEARVLASEIGAAGTPGITASLLFPPRTGGGLGIPTRVGPFGGEDGFRAFLDEAKITAVLDAVHPFAARMSDRSARVCRELGLPYARVLRPPWRAEPADKWTEVSGAAEAGTLLRQGQRVFTTIGRADLPELARSAQATIWARYLRAHPPQASTNTR